jgi:hypothetical protein
MGHKSTLSKSESNETAWFFIFAVQLNTKQNKRVTQTQP